MDYRTLNKTRAILAAIAETIDYFRVAPRVIILCYGYVMYEVVNWYMAIGTIVEGVSVTPSTQHTAFVATMVGVAGVVIGLYQNSGIKWTEFSFNPWNDDIKPIMKKRLSEAKTEMDENPKPQSNEEVRDFKPNHELFDINYDIDEDLY